MSERKDLNRRDFLKGAATAGAGLAVTGVLGAASSTAQAASSPAVKWDQETDILVVGTGGAGLCAAIEARHAGSKVIVIDKMGYVGGRTRLANGGSHLAGTHIQAAKGIKDSPEMWYAEQMKNGEYRADPDLLRTYTREGENLVVFFEQLGMPWDTILAKAEDCSVPRGHYPAAKPELYPTQPDMPTRSGGVAYVEVAARELERLAVPILLNHSLKRIYREPDGPVVGLQVENKTGIINIRTRQAVLLATGGWGANIQMLKAWDRRFDTDVSHTGYPYANTTGDGLMAAEDIGAGLTGMSYTGHFLGTWGGHRSLWEPQTRETFPAMGGMPADMRRIIAVRGNGMRFIDERVDESRRVSEGPGGGLVTPFPSPFQNAYLSLLEERPRNVWGVTDADGAAATRWPEKQMRNPKHDVQPGVEPGCVAVADTIEELARKMGVDPAGLAATVSKWNGFVDAGKDADFGKKLPLYKIVKPPFFGAKFILQTHDQMSGLRANTKGQVLARTDQMVAGAKAARRIDEEQVIPHLYAAGECVGGYLGNYRGSAKMAVYMIWGRIAGQAAAKEPRLA